jgi:hypothetical protein
MTYYTHYRYKDVPQYVYADVPLDYSEQQNTYYTHHRKMVMLLHVSVYVSSDYCDECMIYYTHHRNMDAPQHELDVY